MTGAEPDDEFTENAAPAANRPAVRPEPFNSSKYREIARARLAIVLTVLLAVVLLAVVARSMWEIRSVKDATDLLGVVLAPLVGLVGAATGFYYGVKEKDK